MNIKKSQLDRRHQVKTRGSIGSEILILLIIVYRKIVSPWIPASCRYMPTCSQYGLDAIRMHGAIRGGWLTTKRILRCHPLGGDGYDPVPFKDEIKNAKGAHNG
ncbi:MAG: membrane protein insertion efficiency factor YidD [Candidatus Eisenbacteria bacterium]|uniref:Putative membrane protein insertion efficiency factor n=1 Tax=Eiseniibacteriota bacterium TaxID=2212470 RepID=A0A948W8H1_UNCEI|nr:membrane protein insertion efficiency factor YidD [Candidatus Eisenbacteria bacterium]MBU1950313.1 membrane protein insertion efficiency factor YidD [Candidatus Eisenbacteria bacterium]MBU2693325.1 membrane protein insertion efficiency factor YidD [Candidatus Eisenbacteria bacterium]